MSLLTSLLILIVAARALGHIAVKYGQPAIVGEILAGILLGPSVFGLIKANPALMGISELAIFLVVLSAGLEMNFREVTSVMRGKGLVVALLGFVIPLIAGILIGLAFQLGASRTVFLGLCIAITALPVAVKILESFDLLDSDIARYSVATAIINDVLALLALGVILDLPGERSFAVVASSIALTGGKLILLTLFILSINRLLEYAQTRVRIKRIPEKIVKHLGTEALFGILMVFVLVFGSISEALGFHFVIGAFFGALVINQDFFTAARYAEIERTLASITSGFLGPIFFAYIGLELSLAEFKAYGFVAAVLAASIASKIFAGWLGGKLIGLSDVKSLGIGVILNGRGIMELVIASIAFQKGFIGPKVFSTLVLMGVITTTITPILFKHYVMPRLGKKP